MPNLDIILIECLKEIKTGQSSLDQCLERYSPFRSELEPLLKLALNIRKPPFIHLESSYKQSARALLLQQISSSGPEKRSKKKFFDFGLPERFVWARIAISIVSVLIVFTLLTGGTAYAAQSSLPGDILYPVKTGSENVRLMLAGNDAAKAELSFDLARTRLDEMSELAYRNKETLEINPEGYQKNLETALEYADKIGDDQVLHDLLISSSDNIRKQIGLCDNLIDTYPSGQTNFSSAGNLAINAQIRLLSNLAKYDNLQSSRINLETMQNRLQRANFLANQSQFQTMNEVLLQYRQLNGLGELILEEAQITHTHDTEIENLNLEGLKDYLVLLNTIADQIPPNYQNEIGDCLRETRNFQKQAGFSEQNKGETGQLNPSESQNTEQNNIQNQEGTGNNQDNSGSSGGSGGGSDSGSGGSGSSGGSDSGSDSGNGGSGSSGGSGSDSGSGSDGSGGSGGTDSGSDSGSGGSGSSGGSGDGSDSGSGNSGDSGSSDGSGSDSGSGSGGSGSSGGTGGSSDSGSSGGGKSK